MKNAIQAGEVVELTAPSGGVTSGVGYVIGSIFVVALADADEGDPFSGARIGVVELPKDDSEAVTEGQLAYWDDTAKELRNASDTGRFIIGSIREAKGASATFARVVLDGIHVVAI
jgi:predicted RecA/RadA family phage recombinase